MASDSGPSTMASDSVSAGRGDLPRVCVRHSSGAELEVYLWGATITSWRLSTGQDILFTSSEAVFDGKKAIRGGIPIVFPQFGTNGPLPQHGFARNSQWELVRSGDGAIELALSDNEATRSIWPHSFRLHLRASFDDSQLTVNLECVGSRIANNAAQNISIQDWSHFALLAIHLFIMSSCPAMISG